MALYSLVPYFWQQFFSDDGEPLAGGKVSTFLAGTATPVFTFSDSTGSLNTNPIILSASGRARIYVDPLLSYKFTVTDANNVPVGLDMDPVSWNQATATANVFQAATLGVVNAPAYSFVADPDTGIWSPAANTLAVSTGGVERMRFIPGGSISIGDTVDNGAGNVRVGGGLNGDRQIQVANTTSGTAAQSDVSLQAGTNFAGMVAYSQGFTTSGAAIASSTRLFALGAGGLTLDAIDTNGVIRSYTNGIKRAQINAAGTQTWAPYGAGTATFDASGNITSVSDERFKDRIEPLPYGLDEVLGLRPVQHGYNELSGLEREHLYGGFIAQDVQPVMPLAVSQNDEGYLTLADRPIIGALVNAVKALQAQIEALRAEVAALKAP